MKQARSTARDYLQCRSHQARATARSRFIIGPLDDVVRIETGEHGVAAL